jgi:hypothetical protein
LLVMFLPDGLLGLSSSWRRPPAPAENMARIARWIRASLPANKVDSEKRK